ncbi:Zn(II)2Cys6 transcription factor domain-containing protein [Aspergillus clavatus NRRL 1]|uniref:C6 zinc finger domain protein n=1 Tax=Aspergillus clavatus (strain ATCC 1007 / CBS 513.65 / DSM 816 / NCTC 3887 / NRRL 1 / QM 1276 / 107) TaxID=344612 RepID=A1CFS6_ASPCL|nr:C6 zinc finger domain protein [Aspergillus clavatus NRRL 1]EAW11725.1 C6 zinc finger domain protein [Aspergillus clavatus NRRL 1]
MSCFNAMGSFLSLTSTNLPGSLHPCENEYNTMDDTPSMGVSLVLNRCLTRKERIRKVKCGEEKPNCLRCTSTGRKCEYSSAAQSRQHPSSIAPILAIPPSVLPNTVWRERRAFAYYAQYAAPFIAGGLDLDFWARVVPQVCRSEPAAWDAINAISALFESPDPCFDPVWLSRGDGFRNLHPNHRDALRWYSRSLSSMRARIQRGSIDANVALISCILFICIESLQGRVEAALQLYQQGVRLIMELRGPNGDRTVLRIDSDLLEHTIVPFFIRLGTISLSFSGTSVPGLLTCAKDHIEPGFSSLHSARAAITALAAECMIFKRTVDEHFTVMGQDSAVPQELMSRKMTIQGQLSYWYRAYNDLVNSSDPSDLPLGVTSLLLTYYAATSINIGTCTEQLETACDACLPLFQLLVEQSRVHLEASAGPDGAQPPFTFEMGVGLSLFLTALKCRDPELRREALHLLRKAPPMQNLYKCPPVATFAELVMNLEEADIAPADRISYNRSEHSGGSTHHSNIIPGGTSNFQVTQAPISLTRLIPEAARIHGYTVFRPGDQPWLLGDLDISRWNRGPEQLYLKYSRNHCDPTTGRWRMIDDIVPIDYD